MGFYILPRNQQMVQGFPVGRLNNPTPVPASSSFLPATGTINDTNTVFGYTSLPSIININGGFYQQTGGAITWTWNASTLQATYSSPVGVGGSTWGLK